jgi:hypothetical protein
VTKKRRRSKHERVTMKIEEKIDQNRGDRRVSHAVHRGEKNLRLARYHVMNSTCIHLRVRGSYIYMYRRGRICKEPLEKYNNRKTNTYLIEQTSQQDQALLEIITNMVPVPICCLRIPTNFYTSVFQISSSYLQHQQNLPCASVIVDKHVICCC